MGVRDDSIDHNVVVNGLGTGLASPCEESYEGMSIGPSSALLWRWERRSHMLRSLSA